MAFFALAPVAGAAQPANLEYTVKANYLYKFAPFVEWPARAFAGPASPFDICIAGQDPFGSSLDDAIKGRLVGEHPIEVRRTGTQDGAGDCHILFLGRTAPAVAARIMKAAAGKPVLTVTEGRGGMIQFLMQDGKVRFDVDPAAAQASGLVISSKLLSLAVSNRRGP
jgi:hypothetical protein